MKLFISLFLILISFKAFANQPQFWSDFVYLFNSDFLKQRRSGLKTDVNADDIARSAATSPNKARAAASYLLKIGFLPTQIADSFAISIGGASFYRNRFNSYRKQGLSKKEAQSIDLKIDLQSWARLPKELPAAGTILIVDEAHYAQSLLSKRTQALLR